MQDMTMPGDNFGDNKFLWGTNLLNAVSSYVPRALPLSSFPFLPCLPSPSLHHSFLISPTHNPSHSGQVPQSRLDDMARRILASWYLLGQDSGYPSVTGWTSWNGGVGGPNVQGTHKTVARAVARDGIVLLKNTNASLPLKKPASLAIIGLDSIVNPSGANSCQDRGCDQGTLAMVGFSSLRFCFFLLLLLLGGYDGLRCRVGYSSGAEY
jgi:beta-glucosidase